MNVKEIRTEFSEFENIGDLSENDRELAEAAVEAIGSAYAPYSHFRVGAAVRTSGGHIVKGSNQENAAYPSGLCAERVALFAAASRYPGEEITGIALAGGPDGNMTGAPVTPCGACRQVMAEYENRAGKPIDIIMVGGSAVWKFTGVGGILPLAFDKL